MIWSGVQAGPSDPYQVQLFSTVDRYVLAVGEPLVLTVECWASPASPSATAQLEVAFESGKLQGADSHIQWVRSKPMERQVAEWIPAPHAKDTEVPILAWTRQFILKPTQVGIIQLPAFGFLLAGEVYATEPHQVQVYHIPDQFQYIQQAIVPIVVEAGWNERRQRVLRTGSAFLIAGDALVTSYHVVVDAYQVRVQLPNGKRITTRKVWAVDPMRDIAILHISPKAIRKAGLQPLTLAPGPEEVDDLATFDGVAFTSGWPGGTQHSGAGVLSEMLQVGQDEVVWISSNKVRPGDSGGPLLDGAGRVLGVVSSGFVSTGWDQMPREGMSIATDLRPALVQQLLQKKPIPLHHLRRQRYYDQHPHARAARAIVTLTGLASQGGEITRGPVSRYLAELDVAIAQLPQASGLYFARGSIYKQLGALDKATDAYQTALGKLDQHFPAAFALAYCLFENGNYAGATHWFDYARQFRPYAYLSTFGLAQVLFKDVRYVQSKRYLQQVLHRDAQFVPALYLLAQIHWALGDEAQALQLLVRLKHTNARWGKRLHRALYTPVFHPVVTTYRPRASIKHIE